MSTLTVWSSTPITASPSLSGLQSKEQMGCGGWGVEARRAGGGGVWELGMGAGYGSWVWELGMGGGYGLGVGYRRGG